MAIFDKEKSGPLPGPGTVVGTNVKLTGVLKDTNDITVHGIVEGEVVSDQDVTITDTAEIKGPITANTVTIAGKVNGSVTANEKIELTPTAKVIGSITMQTLVIQSGAVFIGKSTMSDGLGARPSTAKDTAAEQETSLPHARMKTVTYDVDDEEEE